MKIQEQAKAEQMKTQEQAKAAQDLEKIKSQTNIDLAKINADSHIKEVELNNKSKANTELHEENMKKLDNDALNINKEFALKESEEKNRYLLEKQNLENVAREMEANKSLETLKENNAHKQNILYFKIKIK